MLLLSRVAYVHGVATLSLEGSRAADTARLVEAVLVDTNRRTHFFSTELLKPLGLAIEN